MLNLDTVMKQKKGFGLQMGRKVVGQMSPPFDTHKEMDMKYPMSAAIRRRRRREDAALRF